MTWLERCPRGDRARPRWRRAVAAITTEKELFASPMKSDRILATLGARLLSPRAATLKAESMNRGWRYDLPHSC
jgi:hypothetical protein